MVLPRLDGDLTAAPAAAAAATAGGPRPASRDEAAVCVVAAAAGYPGSPRRRATGSSGLVPTAGWPCRSRGHGLPRRHRPRRRRRIPVTAGGRVLGVTGARADSRPRPAPGLRRRGGHPLAGHAGTGRHRRRWTGRPTRRLGSARARDPPLHAAGHGGPLQRRGPARPSGSRSSCWPPRRWAAPGWSRPRRPRRCRARAPKVDAAFVEAVAERERVTDHDVAAFVDVVQEPIGQPEASWIHYGLTSSDVVDTALCATLVRAADLLHRGGRRSVRGPARPGRASSSTSRSPGRTHGMHAEPTTFGAKFALWALQADRDRERLAAARRAGRGREAVGRRRHLLEHRPRGRGRRLPGPRPRPRCRPPR